MRKLVWDEAKRRSNIRKHGLDFAHVADFDSASAVTYEDKRGLIDPKFVYPEPRYISIGLMRGKLVVLVYYECGMARHQSQACNREGRKIMARKVVGVPDDESPEITAETFAKMRPMKDVTPGMAKAIKALRGRPKLANPKQVVSIRLSESARRRWSALKPEKRAALVASFEQKIVKAS